MSTRDQLCSEEDIQDMVHQFYDKIRQDGVLGPIFNAHIHDWDTHLGRMVQFWSSMLRGTGTYEGTPMPKHIALPDLNAELFGHWLNLFHDTLATLPNRAMAEKAGEFSQRIARSLWYGYQLHHKPDAPLREVNRG